MQSRFNTLSSTRIEYLSKPVLLFAATFNKNGMSCFKAPQSPSVPESECNIVRLEYRDRRTCRAYRLTSDTTFQQVSNIKAFNAFQCRNIIKHTRIA